MASKIEDPYLRVGQAAAYLSVSRQYIWRMFRNGTLKADGHLPDGSKRVKKSTCDRLVQSGPRKQVA